MASKTNGAAQLRECRTARELSLSGAAELLQISTSMLSLIENGHREPGRDLMGRIHETFGIEFEEWFRRVA